MEQQITVKLWKSTLKKLKVLAALNEVSVSELVDIMANKELNNFNVLEEVLNTNGQT